MNIKYKLALMAILLFCARAYPAVSGEAAYIEPGLVGNQDILWFSGYETSPSWQPPWGIQWGPSPAGNFSITTTNTFLGNYAARVKYPAGLDSTTGSGTQYKCLIMNMTPISIPAREAMYLRYYVRFDPDFDFALGGKLPGLCGGTCNTGGGIPTGRDGWSARIMWRANGKIVQYMYYMDQTSYYGDDFDWNEGVGGQRYLIPGQWHCLETYIQMNTPGVKDGIVRSWFDGQLSLNRTNIRFRDVGYSNIKIDSLYFSTFFGGTGAQWAPKKDEYANFDNFVLSQSYIGPYMAGTATRTHTPNPLFSPTATFTPTPTIDPACFISDQSWNNRSFTQQAGTFTYTFSAMPSTATVDSVMGLSDGQASGYTSLATIVRFNNTGSIDMRNGGAYQSATVINYQAGKRYFFRIVVNVTTRTYSGYVTPEGGTESIIGINYAFRTEQAGVTKLNNFASYTVGGTNLICNPGLHTDTVYTPTQTPSITRTATATWSFTHTRTVPNSPTRTLTATSSAAASFTVTNSASRTSTYSPTLTHTFTFSRTITTTYTRTVTPIWTNTFTGTATQTNTTVISSTWTPSRTTTATSTATSSPSSTNTSTRTNTPVATWTWTPSSTATQTSTPSRTSTGTNTSTNTFTSTRTLTPTYTNTATPTFTRTISPTHSISPTITHTWTGTPPSPTNTPTITQTGTHTTTRTYTPTSTPTGTSTRTVTSTYTNTIQPTMTWTITATNTQVPTNSYTPTRTSTSTMTWTNTAVDTPTFTHTITPTWTRTFTSILTSTGTFTETWTRTSTSTLTSTHTRTLTWTITITASLTVTVTVTNTSTRTITISETPTNTPAVQEITDVRPYPNPVNPTKDDLKIGFKISQQDIDELVVRIYTSGYRLIKEVKYEGYRAVEIARDGLVNIEIKDLKSLSNGTYYFYIKVDRKGETCRSKIDKLIILR